MKKIKKYWLMVLVLLIQMVYSADVEPFYFDSIAEESQQAEWDHLMKYKVFGQTGIDFIGREIKVSDKVGWFGTSQGDFFVEQEDYLVNGTILIGGDVYIENGNFKFEDVNYVRVDGNIDVGNFNPPNLLNGIHCVSGNIHSKYRTSMTDSLYDFNNCPDEVPEIKKDLKVPAVNFSDKTFSPKIELGNREERVIRIPSGEGVYDLYIDEIEFTNDSKLIIKMPEGGRLTRIFLKKISFGSAQPNIRIHHGNKNLSIGDYVGDLLFYVEDDIDFPAFTRKDTIFGTFISNKTINVRQNMKLAGQLLANKIIMNAYFDGKDFRYIPFDPPVINLNPIASNGSGVFKEGEGEQELSIGLDKKPDTKVLFDYCFEIDTLDLENVKASLVDFKDSGINLPLCSFNDGVLDTINSVFNTSRINIGSLVIDSNVIYLNPIKEGKIEGIEKFKIHLTNIYGAVLSGNEKTGYFDLYVEDGDEIDKPNFIPVIDTSNIYYVEENYVGFVDTIIATDEDSNILKFWGESEEFIVKEDGDIYTKKELNYEKDSVYRLLIYVTDFLDTVSAEITIKVIDINEAPKLKNKEIYISEKKKSGDFITLIEYSDEDLYDYFRQNKTVLIDGDTNYFYLSNDSLYLKEKIVYNKDKNIFNFTIKVYDETDESLFDIAIFTLCVKQDNEPPVIIVPPSDDDSSNVSNPKNHKMSDTIEVFIEEKWTGIIPDIKINTFDLEGDSIIYTIQSIKVPISSYFQITEKGEIEVIRSFEYIDYKKFDFIVLIKDDVYRERQIDNYSFVYVKVNIINVNDPHSVSDTTMFIKENKTGDLGVLEVKDIDGDSVFTFKIIEGDTSIFTINNKGKITVNKKLDYETKNEYIIIVEVGDGEYKDTAKVTVKVIDVYEKSIVTINKIITEDSLWIKPDTVYTNKSKVDVDWEHDGVFEYDYEELKYGKNILIRKFCDSTKNECGVDSVIIYFDDRTPKLEVFDDMDRSFKYDGLTIFERVGGHEYLYEIYTKHVINEMKVVINDLDSFEIEIMLIVDSNGVYVSSEQNGVRYTIEEDKMVKQLDGSIKYIVNYFYKDRYGNEAEAYQEIYYKSQIPKVQILFPLDGTIFQENVIDVRWEIEGLEQDTLNFQSLQKGLNIIERKYIDKYGNRGGDTVYIYMNGAKIIDVKFAQKGVNKSGEKNKSKNIDNIYIVKKGSIEDTKGKTVEDLESLGGVILDFEYKMPMSSSKGGVGTLRDLVESDGISLDVGAGNDRHFMSEYVYVKNHCSAQFIEDYKKNSLDALLFEVKVSSKIWVYDNIGQYVNEYKYSYELKGSGEINRGGILKLYYQMNFDDAGYMVSKYGRRMGTGVYIYKVESEMVYKALCDMPDISKGVVKKEKDFVVLLKGYKKL